MNLVTYFVFFPIEFSCFTASKMFVLERLLTFGTSSMGASSSNRAHRIFKWLLVSLAVMFVVLTVASWTGAGMAAPFSQKGRGLNLYDSSDKNQAAIETGLDTLFVAVAVLYITMSLALVTAAFGCILFCFHCFRRIQQVSLALLQAQGMSSSKTQAVEATLRKTRILIMGTSAVVTFSFIVRAAFQVLYGASFTASYNIQNCTSQCNVGCQGDLFVLQVHARTTQYYNRIPVSCKCIHPRLSWPLASHSSSGCAEVLPNLCHHYLRRFPVLDLHFGCLGNGVQPKSTADVPWRQCRAEARAHAGPTRQRKRAVICWFGIDD
jgi:hypothetical protein